MNFSYRCCWIFARLLCGIYLRWRVWFPERVPLEGPVILASNHASILDPLVIGGALPRLVNFLARDTLFDLPVFGAVIRSWRAVPVDRDGSSPTGLRVILERLRTDGVILLFVEGTRTRDGNLQPARSGVGLAVIKSEAPVVPVRVFGTFEALGRGKRIPRPRRVAVKFGQPMRFEALRAEAKTCPKPRLKEIYQQVANEIMVEIAKLQPNDEPET